MPEAMAPEKDPRPRLNLGGVSSKQSITNSGYVFPPSSVEGTWGLLYASRLHLPGLMSNLYYVV